MACSLSSDPDGCKHFHVRPPPRPPRWRSLPAHHPRFLILKYRSRHPNRGNMTPSYTLCFVFLRDEIYILGFYLYPIFNNRTPKLIEMYFIYKVSTLACRVTWKWRFSPRCDFYFNPIFPARGETDRSSCAGSGPHLLLESIVESNIATLSPPSRCIDHVFTTFSASVFSVARLPAYIRPRVPTSIVGMLLDSYSVLRFS